MSVSITNESDWPVETAGLARLVAFLYSALRLHPQTELSVTLVDVARMSELHEQWMDEPGPTDVLSFPMDELTPPALGELARPGVLGDVVICPQVAQAQAEAAGHGFADEMDLLLTHGVLHLLGYDHAEPAEHAEMFGLQEQLLARWRSGESL